MMTIVAVWACLMVQVVTLAAQQQVTIQLTAAQAAAVQVRVDATNADRLAKWQAEAASIEAANKAGELEGSQG